MNVLKDEFASSEKSKNEQKDAIYQLEQELYEIKQEKDVCESSLSELKSAVEVLKSDHAQFTSNLQGNIKKLKDGKASLESAMEEMDMELVSLKESKSKLESDLKAAKSGTLEEGDYEEYLAKLVKSLSMLSVLENRHEELLTEYGSLAEKYNTTHRTHGSADIIIDHLTNLGIVETMIFELKKKGGKLYRVRDLKRSIAAELIEEYIDHEWGIRSYLRAYGYGSRKKPKPLA